VTLKKAAAGTRYAFFIRINFGEEKETIEQTRAGAIDLNRTNVALIGSFVPAMNVLAMPFLFRSMEHLHKVLDGPIGNEILGSFEPYGFVGLTFMIPGPVRFTTASGRFARLPICGACGFACSNPN